MSRKALLNFRGFTAEFRKQLILALLLTALFVVGIMPSFASFELEVDPTILFDNINSFLPVAFGIFGLIGGVMIAFALAKYIVNSFSRALEGREI